MPEITRKATLTKKQRVIPSRERVGALGAHMRMGILMGKDSSGTAKPRAPRVSRREFVQRIARRTNQPVDGVQQVYDAMVAEIIELTTKGYNVTFTGFGRFYTQPHKGHRVRFADPDGTTEVPDYMTLKFSATSAINKQIKEAVGVEKAPRLLAEK